MAYAIRYPDQVAHMVLMDSGSPDPKTNEFLFDKLYPEIMAKQKLDSALEGQTGCITPLDYENMSYYDQRNRSSDSSSGNFNTKICTILVLDAFKHNMFPALHKVNVSTLVLSGRFDANVSPADAYAISQAIPRAKMVFFEHSGHSPYEEEPDRFELIVGRFLENQLLTPAPSN
jgi:proline iminopeptidase